MTAFPVLTRDALGAITALCERALPADRLTAAELDGALFAPEQPATVFGDPSIGIAAVVEAEETAHLRLLAVDPDARGQGHGRALLRAAEEHARAAGSPSLTTGADAPYFLWAGVPTDRTALVYLLERHHYARVEANFDMTVTLHDLPPEPAVAARTALTTNEERDEVDAWMAKHWSNWRLEVLRALDKGNLVISREPDGDIGAFCAFEVNRAGFLGPVAVRPDLIGRAHGHAALLTALHELRRRGRDRVEVVWVGPVVPYVRVGGRVSTVYFVYRRDLA